MNVKIVNLQQIVNPLVNGGFWNSVHQIGKYKIMFAVARGGYYSLRQFLPQTALTKLRTHCLC